MAVSRLNAHLHKAPLALGLALGCHAWSAFADEQPAATKKNTLPDTSSQTSPNAPSANLSNAGGKGPKTTTRKDGSHVEEWVVTASPMNTLHTPIGLSRMPDDVLHTPQTIDVVPQIVMQQQNVKSLDEALKNVPGITASVGEGEGGMSGDQFLIRGFAANNDIYENGLRDFGVYTRDSFDYERVVVIKGPSSQVFGNGTTGGAINVVTKTPTAKNHYRASFSGGSGNYYRGTLDINHKITDTIAFRLTGMGNENDMIGRNAVYSHRWGIAPSIIFGLGKKLNYTVEYFHQTDNRLPDYGVPMVKDPKAAYSAPATEYGVKRTNWYGTTLDADNSSVDMLTGRLQWEANRFITISNDTRGGLYSRYFSASGVGCTGSDLVDTNGQLSNSTTSKNNCSTALFGGNAAAAKLSRTGGVFGPNPYQQDDWSVQNVLSAIAKFNTGRIRHQMLGGLDIMHVYDQRKNYAYNNPVARQYVNLLDPSAYVPGLSVIDGNSDPGHLVNTKTAGQKLWKKGDATDIGLFLSEQAWVTPWFSIRAGLRWDHWSSNYSMTGGKGADVYMGQTQDTINPNVSLMYTPNDHAMVYFTWSESTTPLGLYVTNSSEPLTTNNQKLQPERSRLYELGAKYSAFHDRIGFTASVFRLEKSNATMQDSSVSGGIISSGDSQRNQGLELSVSGQILRNWNMIATYARYDSITTGGTAADIGKQLQYVPRNQATVWTTYEIAPSSSYNLLVGGGMTWREGVFVDPANTGRVPANVEFDTVISHRFDNHWKVAMNGYNLANRLNYSNLFSDRVTPSIGRAFLFNLSADY